MEFVTGKANMHDLLHSLHFMAVLKPTITKSEVSGLSFLKIYFRLSLFSYLPFSVFSFHIFLHLSLFIFLFSIFSLQFFFSLSLVLSFLFYFLFTRSTQLLLLLSLFSIVSFIYFFSLFSLSYLLSFSALSYILSFLFPLLTFFCLSHSIFSFLSYLSSLFSVQMQVKIHLEICSFISNFYILISCIIHSYTHLFFHAF